MDRVMWEAIKEACIAGDSYLYFYDGALDCQLIDNMSVFLGDEQQPDLQRQPYIILYERRNVEEIREDARKNGLPEEEIVAIVPDEDAEGRPGTDEEVEGADKCACLLYMTKRDGALCFARATRTVVYQPETAVEGMSLYPVASLVWMRKKGSARGNGEVTQLIPNQIAVNRLLARREISTKMTAFAKPVYSSTAIVNAEDVSKVGAALEVQGGVQRVGDAFAYIAPSPMASDAHLLQSELLSQTRELAGAGDAVLGSVNPEQASGAAIIAVRDQAAIPLNEQVAMYRQFVEDIALIWHAAWIAYHPSGVLAEDEHGSPRLIPPGQLKSLKLGVRVDVSPTSPYSKFAQEQSLENALAQGHISFEEYVEALDGGAVAPKARLQDILRRRAVEAEQEPDAAAGIPQMPFSIGQTAGLSAQTGGEVFAMPMQG